MRRTSASLECPCRAAGTRKRSLSAASRLRMVSVAIENSCCLQACIILNDSDECNDFRNSGRLSRVGNGPIPTSRKWPQCGGIFRSNRHSGGRGRKKRGGGGGHPPGGVWCRLTSKKSQVQ